MSAVDLDARQRPRLTGPRVLRVVLRAQLGPTAVWAAISVLLVSVCCGLIAGIILAAPPPLVPPGVDPPPPLDPVAGMSLAIGLSAIGLQLFAVWVGAESVAGDYARGTIAALLVAVPRRGLLLRAKVAAACGTVVVVSGLAGLSSGAVAIGSATLLDRPLDAPIGPLLASAGGLALGNGLLTLLALALGALTRSRVAALVVPVAAVTILPALPALLPSAVRDWVHALSPATALTGLAMPMAEGDGALSVQALLGVSSGAASLPFWGSLLVLLGWCALLVPWAVAAFLRHDLSATARGRLRRRARDAPPRWPAQAGPHRSTFGGRLRSELRKSWSLPAVRWLAGAAIAIVLLQGLARAASDATDRGLELEDEFVFAMTDGVGGMALLLAVLAAIQVAGEFESGTAVSTYIAAPRRQQVVTSKLVMTGASSVVLAGVALALTLPLVISIYTARGLTITGDILLDGVLAALRAILYLLVIALLCTAVAGLLRRRIAAVAAVVILLMLGPALLNTIGGFAVATGAFALVPVSNLVAFLPSGGVWFYGPGLGLPLAAFDQNGRLHLSGSLTILIAAVWTVVAVAAWFLVDRRRPIVVRA